MPPQGIINQFDDQIRLSVQLSFIEGCEHKQINSQTRRAVTFVNSVLVSRYISFLNPSFKLPSAPDSSRGRLLFFQIPSLSGPLIFLRPANNSPGPFARVRVRALPLQSFHSLRLHRSSCVQSG